VAGLLHLGGQRLFPSFTIVKGQVSQVFAAEQVAQSDLHAVMVPALFQNPPLILVQVDPSVQA
jgi:hypothetical protein